MLVVLSGCGILSLSIGSWNLIQNGPNPLDSSIHIAPPLPLRTSTTTTTNTTNMNTSTTIIPSQYTMVPYIYDKSYICNDPAVSFLKLASTTIYDDDDNNLPTTTTTTTINNITIRRRRPKLLCLILTQPSNHGTKMKTILDTWGKKCDRIVGSSEGEDLSLHTYHIESIPGYWGLFDKVAQSLRWILDEDDDDENERTEENEEQGTDKKNKHHPEWSIDEYDWILKADDDTYVIMENLWSFLSNVTYNYHMNKTKYDTTNDNYVSNDYMSSIIDEPRIYGRVMAWPRLQRFKRTWFDKEGPNVKFGRRFYHKLGKQDTLRFAHGGPGYIMTKAYVKRFVDTYFNQTADDTLHGEIAEDMGSAATMLYQGIKAKGTVDITTGRERMHPEPPQIMYENPDWLKKAHRGIERQLKGKGELCCSPYSISYHYVTEYQMRLLDYQLYNCTRP